MDQLSPTQRAAVDRQLDPGERLLWAAGTSTGMQAGALAPGCVGVPFVLFGLWPLLTALSRVRTVFDEQNGLLAFLIFAGFGTLFTGVGVLAIRQGFRSRRDEAAAVWAVTDRRFFKAIDRPNRRVLEAVPLRFVTGVDVVEYGDGSGSLTITTDAPHNLRRKGAGARRGRYLIMGVRDAANARRIIQTEVDRAAAEHRSD
ncbi:hypothetical protein [Sphingomonas sp.]|uniref:hypothetical protein n=1 Tax=Sphingomonas sp. TaxID=28214 RepID=UPI003B00CE3C